MTDATKTAEENGFKKAEAPKHEVFWDIESYDNLFICGMLNENNFLEMFYLVNEGDDKAVDDIRRACEDSPYEYKMYDLSQDMERFAWHFEKRIPTGNKPTILSDWLGESTKPVKPKEDWYFGYNTLQYDIPMIDHLLESNVGNRLQTTPQSIREYSNDLIERKVRFVDTSAYEQYANQVDCAYLNEKMIDRGHPTVGLKTLVGIKGGSIIESPSNSTGHSNDIYYDTLYNINDIVELRDVVYPGVMETTFKNREFLLSNFASLKENGITVNSSSAKFVEYIVAPEGPIKDYENVTFMYPAPHIAKRLGVPQTDILEDTKAWYMENVFNVVKKNKPKVALEHLAKFMSIYSFYDSLRGKNWNDSASHDMEYHNKAYSKLDRDKLFDEFGTYLPFINAQGEDTGTYANFSLGGIHGAEINHEQLENDRKVIGELREKYGKISMIPSSEINQQLKNILKKQSRTTYKGYPQHLSHEIPFLYKKTEEVDDIMDPAELTPFMYTPGSSSRKPDGRQTQRAQEGLLDRYKYTSIGDSAHQDFDGYYVMLLINMGVFYDGHGKDVYDEIYQFRLDLKRQLKSLEYGTKEYELANTQQLGYKLVLNSASGILDASFDTRLRANNKALSMRGIGNLFTFRIGMMLAMAGASIPSSNTDGVYAFNIDLALNKKLVDAELKKLYVKIKPEPCYLVSKDANNRMEVEDGKVTSSRGATLTSAEGASVENRLAHPAMVDKVMTLYLQNEGVLDGDVKRDLIDKAIEDYLKDPKIIDTFEEYNDAAKRSVVYMSSWIMRSTSGSIMVSSDDQVYPGTIRSWLTKDGVNMKRYAVRKAKPSKKFNEYASQLFPNLKVGDPDLIAELTRVGAYPKYFEDAITVKDYREQVEEYNNALKAYESGQMPIKPTQASVGVVGQSKISGLPKGAKLHIDNHSIIDMSEEEIDAIYQSLDLKIYGDMIADFAKTWQNVLKPSTGKKSKKKSTK